MSMHAASRRPGFTLLELAVVTAIAGLLLSLLLPALQQARSAVRRNECASHLRKIGLAMHAYHSTYRSFPAGVENPDENPSNPPGKAQGYHPWWSWMALTSQFLDGRNVYEIADGYAQNVSYWPWGGSGNPALGIPLPIWICPADDPARFHTNYGQGLSVAFTSYLGVSGISDYDSAFRPQLGKTVGAPRGVLFLLSKIHIRDITDGTGNTVMVGERPPSSPPVWGWWFAGAEYPGKSKSYYTGGGWTNFTQKGTGDVFLGAREDDYWQYIQTHEGVSDPVCKGPMKLGLVEGGLDSFCDQAHLWSLHPGGANFLFASGAVRFLSYRDNNVFPQLCTRAGRDFAPGP
jgi:prepilin-type N-terminal cleavage/methylation domain-containing protein